jgi:6-phosphogluconolactonase (cycloisomerase 2 family)
MRAKYAVAIASLLFGAAFLNAQEANSPKALAERIERLIKQLDDEKFEVREKAEKDLAAIGEPAREKLTAATKDASFERSQRAAKLLKELRRNSAGLSHVQTVTDDGLKGMVTVAISPDGKFVYVPGFQAGAVGTFRRDDATGMLEFVTALHSPNLLGGAVSFRLSPDGKRGVSACFSAQTITLLARDEKSGGLEIEASAGKGEPALEFPIDATFSADGKFVYAVDDSAGAVIVFDVSRPKQMKHVQTLVAPDGCFQGARGVTAHPDGKTLYISAARAGTLSVLDRDPASGKVAVRQVLYDGQDGVRGLAGTMGTVVSQDGKFVYAASGRFDGDNAVGVFQVGSDGKLSVVQEIVNDEGELENFTGGNELTLSPDGKWFYASGTTSCGLACFRRDAVTGKLEFVTTIRNETTGVGADLGANGIAVSPDGRFLYLALEDSAAIAVFERALEHP